MHDGLPLRPPDGWTLDNLPDDLPKRTELIRGALIMSPQTTWHMTVVRDLFHAVQGQMPDKYSMLCHMAVYRTRRTAPEPDLSIARAEAVDWDTSVLQPQDVVLAGEVITPESEERDREDKPLLYAAMGIPTFWLIERGPDGAPMVHEHQLYGGAYRLMKTHVGRMKTEIPFSMDVRLGPPRA